MIYAHSYPIAQILSKQYRMPPNLLLRASHISNHVFITNLTLKRAMLDQSVVCDDQESWKVGALLLVVPPHRPASPLSHCHHPHHFFFPKF